MSPRTHLVNALHLDLVGPQEGLGSAVEVLPQAPSRWYLTGFLIPLDSDATHRAAADGNDELDSGHDAAGGDDGATPEPAAARQRFFPSSMGLSVLLPAQTTRLQVITRWGDYRRSSAPDAPEEWQRTDREETVTIEVPKQTRQPKETAVPHSDGLMIALTVRPVVDAARSTEADVALPTGTRSASIFLVNRRSPAPDDVKDSAWAFQAQIEVICDEGFVPRPNLRNLHSDDWDERVADLQYRNACEFAVGHNVGVVSGQLAVVSGQLSVGSEGAASNQQPTTDNQQPTTSAFTCWIPTAEVERVAPSPIVGVELSMRVLGNLADGAAAKAALGGMVTAYRDWIAAQREAAPQAPARRKETAQELLARAQVASDRIARGIALLDDPVCLQAFRLANRAMATAAGQRLGVMKGLPANAVDPQWRPFQLAFLLMNLPGIANPADHDREVVDLLFFPTGGGKTEAYLGLAAFTLVLRRLRNPGISSAGLSVLMRYTLRLLTLDQLGRAATLICALEMERQKDAQTLGDWPFEIGLWVGKAATPNVMGAKGDGNNDSARAKTIAYKNNDDAKPKPIPLEDCPWCGTKFKANSFTLLPSQDFPTDLRITCLNRDCAFSRNNPLPILAVDEPIYRRLPCFLIATVDKFAAMPWTAEVGGFFGRVQRHDSQGFYGPAAPQTGHPLPGERLLPPDLVIQDELHLISGPLGTMAGLYETALDELATIERDGRRIRPKIVASTATVRRAESQIRALFNHRLVEIFPPPGPNRRDSFFAYTQTTAECHARQYVGVAAPGRSPKVVMLRVYLALMAAAQKWYQQHGSKPDPANPADPYMTLLGYFNSLRELGGARRLIEDEVRNRLAGYGMRRRKGEAEGPFVNRKIAFEPLELTSRVSTAQVADAKRRLEKPYSDKEHVDVAIATNMISVGLDITRLGLMVVYGQPKTSAEYIQATSRVGRDPSRPGLVVTILNIHKPRDRSHYERFSAYHESFYRSVEATSVTPFSPRALDRGLAGTLVALARQGHRPMTPARGAVEILRERTQLDFVVETLADRARECSGLDPGSPEAQELAQRVRGRALELLDDWSRIAHDLSQTGVALQYQQEVGGAQRLLYEFLNPDLRHLPAHHAKMKFRANRSLRDVEPVVALWIKAIDGATVPGADEEEQP